jgi:short-subunit dehydrogenase
MVIAVVTGSSSGIGKAIYEHLKRLEGAAFDRVLGVSRNGPDITADLTDLGEIDELVGRLQTHDIGCLVNCAGVLRIPETEADGFDLFELHFWAPYRLMIGLEEQLLRADSGCVINIASNASVLADPDTPIYAASKAALVSLSKSLAIKWAP